MSEHHAWSTSSSGEGQQPTAQQETARVGWQSEEAGLSPQLDKTQIHSDRDKFVA